ncbi:MAG: shikimate kinase [Oscillospiraceae bacterium]
MLTIYLCGFMGCGKSTVGRALAEWLGHNNKSAFPFTDLDEYIVKRERRSIKNIFDIDGEEYFRRLEIKSMLELSNAGGVIALGGGAILSEEASRAANSSGEVVFINVPFDVCYERIMREDLGRGRPLVMTKSRIELENLYAERASVYTDHSSITVDGDAPVEMVVQRIIDALSNPTA